MTAGAETHASPLRYRIVPSPYGDLALLWAFRDQGPRILRVCLPAEVPAGVDEAASADTCPAIEDLARLLWRYFSGEAVTFPLKLCAWEICSPFQQRVLRAEAAIPRGRVSTYGRIARRLGVPRAARAVGRALATNPFALLIPCHRTVRGDGALGGYRGGLAMKRALLALEGVAITREGRVDLRQLYEWPG